MKLSSVLSFLFSKRSLAIGAVAALAANSAQARNDGAVSYSPGLQIVQGDMPLASAYALTITSPSSLTGPAVVTLSASLFQAPPAGVSNITALSFVAIVPNIVTFTAPNQSVTVQVISTVPLGNWAGSYVYQIKTSGWPTGLAYTDGGAFINAVFSPPPVPANPPTIVINNPVNQSVWNLTPGSSLPIPFEFVANSPDGSPLLTLTGGVGSTNLSFTPTGLGTANANASGNFLVNQPGIYTVHAETSNAVGVASASSQVRVVIQAGPPSVTINTPDPDATFVMEQGGSLDVPFTFTGTSQYGGVQALFADLDGVPVAFTPSGYGNLVANGAGTLHLTAGGQYTLHVIAVDNYGTAESSTTFTVNVQAPQPPPTVVINNPDPDAQFTLTAGSPLSIPFSFTGSSTGGPITNITAKLNGSPITFSTTGLNTTTATGTANLSVNAVGNYTLLVTATNSVGTATTSQAFSVIPSSTSVIKVGITSPSPNATVALNSYGNVSVPATFTSNSTAPGGVNSLKVSVGNNSLNITTSTLNKPVVTGNGTLKFTAAGVYTITAVATDAFGTATTSQNITVTSPAPCPNVVIASPCDGASYNIVCNQPLWVTVTLNAKTTPGSTLSTLTATLNGANITLNVTGLGTTKATATAKVKITSAGTFTLKATTTSGGVSDTDDVTFKVRNGSGYTSWGSNYGSWDNDYNNNCYTIYRYSTKYPTPCNVDWQQSWSCNTTQKGGTSLPLCFQVKYTGSSCLYNWSQYYRDYDDQDYFGCDDDDRYTYNHWGFYNCLSVSAPSSSTCMNNRWDYVNGVKCSDDTSVRVLVYEIKSNGSTGTPQVFTCGKSAKGNNYTIGSGNQYQLNFTTAKGTHKYRADVYYYKGDSNSATFLGSTQFCTK